MNRINCHTTIRVLYLLLIVVSAIFSQDNNAITEIALSPCVGTTINLDEREKFELFKDVDGFQSAKTVKMPDGKIQINITYIDTQTGKEKTLKWYPTDSEVLRMQEQIDHYEEIESGQYISKYQLKKVKSGVNFEIQDSLVTIELKDGSSLKGSIVRQDQDKVYFKTINGMESVIPKFIIVKIEPMKGKIVEGNYLRLDPNYSRLLFAPTGRPLNQGEGYFSDYYVFFPGISYGFTNNISLMAGFSFIPGASFDEQLKYVAPKIGINVNEKFSVAAGALYINVQEVSAGIGFLVGTVGERDKCFTMGLGLGYTKEEGEDLEFAKHPILMLGGNIRMSNSVAFVSENWIITGEDFDLAQQPFSFGFRFFGDHVSADVAFIIIMDVLDEGFPVPWLSFTYNFGN